MRLCEIWNNYGQYTSFGARLRQAGLCVRWAFRVLVNPRKVRQEVVASSACIEIMRRHEKERADPADVRQGGER